MDYIPMTDLAGWNRRRKNKLRNYPTLFLVVLALFYFPAALVKWAGEEFEVIVELLVDPPKESEPDGK